MGDIENLNEARAVKEENACLWTPLEAMEALVRDIKSGKTSPNKIIAHHLTTKEGGGESYGYTVAGLDIPEHIALLELAKFALIQERFE